MEKQLTFGENFAKISKERPQGPLLILLTVLFFSAAPKKTWQFIVVLSFGITVAFISCISRLTLRAPDFNIWHLPYIFTNYISGALFWIALAMLIAPGKKHIATDTPSTPVA